MAVSVGAGVSAVAKALEAARKAAEAAARKAAEAAAREAQQKAAREAQRAKPKNPDIASKKGENNLRQDIFKSDLQKKVESGLSRAFDNLVKPIVSEFKTVLQKDIKARQAAKEVEQTYSKAMSKTGTANRRGSTGLSAAEDSARKLREVTKKQSPEVAALTLKYAQPTIDRVTADLGSLPKQKDKAYVADRRRFDNAVSDLAAAAAKASSAPNGREAVGQAAKSFVKNIDPDDTRLVNAFNKAISRSGKPALQKEFKAQLAAKEVERAYKNPTTDNPISNLSLFRPSPQQASARKLREITEKQSPEVAALTLKYAQPTIDRITADLGRTAKENDGDYGDDKPTFDNVVSDLAAATSKAAESPNGKESVKQVAASLVKNIDEGDIGRFDEALGKPVENGSGTELSLEVVRQLTSAGRSQEARDIMGNVADGVKKLKENIGNVSDEFSKINDEFQRGLDMDGAISSPQEKKNYVEAFKKRNPEFDENLKNLDQMSRSAVKALNMLPNLPETSPGARIPLSGEVSGALNDLTNDEKTQTVISTMKGASSEIQNLVKRDASGERTFLDQLKEGSSVIKASQDFTEQMTNTLLKSTMNAAIEAKLTGNPQESARIINNLSKYGNGVGVDGRELKIAANGLKYLQRATNRASFETRFKQLDKIEAFNTEGTFAPTTARGQVFRGAAVLLSAPGVISSFKNRENLLDTATALTGATQLTTDSAQLLAGVIKSKNFEAAGSTAFKVGEKGLEKAGGKILPGVGIVLDGISAGKSFAKGDYVAGGLSTASLVGGVLLLTPGLEPLGAAILVGAAVGQIFKSSSDEANYYENEKTTQRLEDLGFTNPVVAKALTNQDGDGNSPVPVFAALAEKLGVKPQEYLDYFNSLSPDRAAKLESFIEEHVHGIDPDENGAYPVNKDGGFDNDLGDLAYRMVENGFADAPGIGVKGELTKVDGRYRGIYTKAYNDLRDSR